MPTLASSTLSFAIACGTYLNALCLTPPNPPNPSGESKEKPANRDRVVFITGRFATIARRILTTVAVYHVILALYYPNAPAKVRRLCPHPGNLSEELFTWSRVSVAALLAIVLGATIRLSAFGGLGRSFTFALAAPDKLVTNGIYRFVQHPSYTGQVIVIAGVAGLFYRRDATPACFVDRAMFEWLGKWDGLAMVGLGIATVVTTTLRVRDEERMLREKFGEEWLRWHRSTKRFIPGVV